MLCCTAPQRSMGRWACITAPEISCWDIRCVLLEHKRLQRNVSRHWTLAMGQQHRAFYRSSTAPACNAFSITQIVHHQVRAPTCIRSLMPFLPLPTMNAEQQCAACATHDAARQAEAEAADPGAACAHRQEKQQVRVQKLKAAKPRRHHTRHV